MNLLPRVGFILPVFSPLRRSTQINEMIKGIKNGPNFTSANRKYRVKKTNPTMINANNSRKKTVNFEVPIKSSIESKTESFKETFCS